MSDDRETWAARHQALTTSEPPQIVGAAVALVRRSGSVVSPVGTGSLFVVADQHFVVTAGHVVAEAARLGSALGVAGGGGDIIHMPGPWTCSHAKLDLGFCRLSTEQAEHFADKIFIRLSNVEFTAKLSDGIFFAFGFLKLLSEDAQKEHERVGLGALRLGAMLANVDTTGLADYVPEVHFLLNTPDAQLVGPDGGEISLRDKWDRRVLFVDGIQGASGSAVWRLCNPEAVIRAPHTADWRVAGVLTGNYGRPRELVKVTRWSAVLGFMASACPDLRDALSLVVPA